MKLRFSMRGLLGAFVLASVIIGWMALNLRRAQHDRAVIAALGADESLETLKISVWLNADSDLTMLTDFCWTSLGQSTPEASVYIGGYPFATPCAPGFVEGMAEVSSKLDSLAMVKVTTLSIYNGDPGSTGDIPDGAIDGAWLAEVRSLDSCFFTGLPFERMKALESLELYQCSINGNNFEHVTFPHLTRFVAMASHVRHPEAFLACAVRSPGMTELDLTHSSTLPVGIRTGRAKSEPPTGWIDETRGLWTEESLKIISGAQKLEELRIDSIEASGDGFAALAKCPRLRTVLMGEAVVQGPLDPLLSHPTLESVEFVYSDLRHVSPPTLATAGRALKRVVFDGDTTQEVNRRTAQWCEARGIEFAPGDTELADSTAVAP